MFFYLLHDFIISSFICDKVINTKTKRMKKTAVAYDDQLYSSIPGDAVNVLLWYLEAVEAWMGNN